MRVTTSKSKNSESFYITKSYTNAQGKSTSTTIKKLGTLAELSERLGTDRDGVMAWAKEQARIETEKYKKKRKRQLLRSRSIPTDLWTITEKNFLLAVISSSSLSLWSEDGFHLPKDQIPLQI